MVGKTFDIARSDRCWTREVPNPSIAIRLKLNAK